MFNEVSRAGSSLGTVEPEFGAPPESELSWRLRQQEILSSFGLFALRCRNIDDLLTEATRACAEGMNVDLCKYLERSADGSDRLLVRAGVGWENGVVGVETLGGDLESPAGYAMRTAQPVISNHLVDETRFRTPDLLARHGVKRALNVPVKNGADDRYGILEVDSAREGKFTRDDIAFVQAMANAISAAMDRHRTEAQLRQAREREQLLLHEMRHRVKNLFTVVAGLLTMSEREASQKGDRGLAMAFARERIAALGRASDMGFKSTALDTDTIDPVAVSRAVLAPYAEHVDVHGEAVSLEAKLATPIALVLHELATNSVKYGALSRGEGHVVVEWSTEAGHAALYWSEYGGPELVSQPAEHGFGLTMLRGLAASVGGSLETEWDPEGLRVAVRFARVA